MRILSIDLGEKRDYAAFSITDSVGEPLQRFEGDRGIAVFYDTIHLERYLHVPYPELVERTWALMQTPELKEQTDLIVDATGVGLPVVQMMQQKGLHPTGIWITGGQVVTEDREIGGFRVPKEHIANAMDLVLQARRWRVARGIDYREALLKEARAFTKKVETERTATYEAAREDDHDDLVMSVAMALWWATRGGIKTVDVADVDFGRNLRGESYDQASDWDPFAQ